MQLLRNVVAQLHLYRFLQFLLHLASMFSAIALRVRWSHTEYENTAVVQRLMILDLEDLLLPCTRSWSINNSTANSITITSFLLQKLYPIPLCSVNYCLELKNWGLFLSIQSFCLQSGLHTHLKPEAILAAEGRTWVPQNLHTPFPAQPLSLGVAFDFVPKHLPTLTVPLWGFSTNKVDLWESSRFSDSSGAPSPRDHTEMQREGETSIIWGCFTPSKVHLPELPKLSSPSTFLFRCPERHVSFGSHWHPLLGCHIVYSSCKNATSVVAENETIREEQRGTWSARIGHWATWMAPAFNHECFTEVTHKGQLFVFQKRWRFWKHKQPEAQNPPHLMHSFTGSLSTQTKPIVQAGFPSMSAK